MMADRCQHGERQHHQRDMTVPGASFIMIKAQFVLAGLETVFDVPALPFHRDQRLDAGASRAPGGEVGARAISEVTPDQQAAGPQSTSCLRTFLSRFSQVIGALLMRKYRP